MREGRWVASLWASVDQPREWTKEEVALLQTVAERTWTAIGKLRAETERERLLENVQEARDAAEKANQLKDEFLATLSHELRNPLNVILGYSELLLRMKEIEQSPRLVQMGEALRRNAQSQSQLINDLLDLSRLQRGKISLNQETVSLPAIIDNAVETVRTDAATKGVEIRLQPSEQLLLVEGDRLRLQQIAWNILNNAVKFTPPGGSIEIGLNSEGDRAAFVVNGYRAGNRSELFCRMFLRCFVRRTAVIAGDMVEWELASLSCGSSFNFMVEQSVLSLVDETRVHVSLCVCRSSVKQGRSLFPRRWLPNSMCFRRRVFLSLMTLKTRSR